MGDENNQNGGDYSSFIVDDGVPLHKLTPNTIYKVCPKKSTALGDPICGDGSPFCFYVSRPPQRYDDGHRAMIELIGGGACWDAQTCAKQSSYLYVDSQLDNFLGRSCSEAQVMGIEGNGKAVNMLCATVLGEAADLRQYTSIHVPYCTQDVHTGSNQAMYNEGDDDSNTLLVHHTGAHNLLSVVGYVKRNFRTLDTAFITGCSAGGTGLPALFRLLDQRYPAARINAISDSPVYLTPAYFLEVALPEWNSAAFLSYLGIPYRKFQSDTAYSTLIWDYILRHSSRRNKWGFLSHTDDPVSQTYFTWMGGNGGGDRKLEDNQDQWYQELTGSIESIQSKHSNVDVFWMDSEGHCTLGLYYGLQEEGFTEWASNIVHDAGANNLRATTRFGVILALGAALATALYRRRSRLPGDDALLQTTKEPRNGWRQRISVWTFALQQRWDAVASVLQPFPLTSAYMIVITIYFWIMILDQGLAHPLNNPAMGPSAVGLSRYGILNPAMVRQRWQWYRWLSSSFVCSGIVTYLIALANLWWRIRPLEAKVKESSMVFGSWAVLTLMVNAVSSLVRVGASTSCLPVILGLAASSTPTVCSGISLLFEAAIVAVLFPYNSWIMMVTSLCCGAALNFSTRNSESDDTSSRSIFATKSARFAAGFGALLIPILAISISQPNSLFLEPFYTGCTIFWSNQISDLSSMGDGRRLVDLDEACAQVCIPHLATPFVGLVPYGSFLERGLCEDQGYYHSFDKTYTYMTYSLDAEIYFAESNDDDGGNN